MADKIQMRVKANGDGPHVEAKARKHTIIIDEPTSQGGRDEGANPLETLLASLAGCENAVANMVAKEMDFNLKGLDFQVKGELDPRGMMGTEGVRRHFETVTVDVTVDTDESDERIQELKEKTDDRCPVFQTLVSADVQMNATWTRA
ncbi:osmotically inducible protein C [Pontibacillus halophilus JSM 076056 = DSM 19796]|uniref:Osmotically inducible protein C n=1 Tax=Pontibacillus halophilus JSM 076056 = DSM 19796 TaxID=1385510 RepID=A0A0A5GR77_9BACI|nr:OsmC family protein [Pontibacillus halophilus]KGX93758.1 osmotically inducible protein C [Pontibacillus halophilus JSM 076056 = DSM 19796]